MLADSSLLTYILTSATLDPNIKREDSIVILIVICQIISSVKERQRIWKFARHHLSHSASVFNDHIIQAICDRQMIYGSKAIDSRDLNHNFALVQSLSISTDALPDNFVKWQ